MKNKSLLFFFFLNLGVGIWNTMSLMNQPILAGRIILTIVSTFSFLITFVLFWTFYVTNGWKMTPWHWNLVVTEVMAMVGIIVSMYLWVNGAKQPEAMFQELRVFPPHSPVFLTIAIVMAVLGIWYAVIEINVKKSLNRATMPSSGVEKK